MAAYGRRRSRTTTHGTPESMIPFRSRHWGDKLWSRLCAGSGDRAARVVQLGLHSQSARGLQYCERTQVQKKCQKLKSNTRDVAFLGRFIL